MRALLHLFKTDLQKFWWLFLYILLAENVLVLCWGYSIWGEAGPDGQPYSIFGIYSMAMLCSAAASLTGGLIGFLFGVPQVDTHVQVPDLSGDAANARPGAPAGAAAVLPRQAGLVGEAGIRDGAMIGSARLRPNTNLEKVSDGLTKAILGIGLSQFYKFPGWVSEVASFLGGSFGPGNSGKVVAISVLTYGFLEGALFAYIATRVYLSRAFGSSDPL
jgi:hypothetical protein